MPKIFTSKTQKTGELGEKIAFKYFISKGFEIIEKNYTKKWGEVDIIAKKRGVTHFIEVKTVSVSYETETSGVSREKTFYIRPEENMTAQKYRKLERTVLSYIAEKNITTEFQIDFVAVYLSDSNKEAHIKVFEKISF